MFCQRLGRHILANLIKQCHNINKTAYLFISSPLLFPSESYHDILSRHTEPFIKKIIHPDAVCAYAQTHIPETRSSVGHGTAVGQYPAQLFKKTFHSHDNHLFRQNWTDMPEQPNFCDEKPASGQRFFFFLLFLNLFYKNFLPFIGFSCL